MTQYPTTVDREGDIWHLNTMAPLYCLAAGCRYQTSTSERLLVATAGEDDAPVRPRWAIEGSDLCGWHTAQLARVLADLVELHGLVEKALIRRAPSGLDDPRVQTSGIRDVGDFWNPMAARVLADLRDWARDLTNVVLTDRPVPEPDVLVFGHIDTSFTPDGSKLVEHSQVDYQVRTFSHGLSLDDGPRLQLAALARHHARWLALYPALGGAILAEALAHRRHALKSVDAQGFRRVVLPGKRCSVIVEHAEFGDVFCHGQLVGVLNEGEPSAVVCTTDPAHVIARDDWMAHAS